MGNPENVSLVQKMHELILAKQFDEVDSLFLDSVFGMQMALPPKVLRRLSK